MKKAIAMMAVLLMASSFITARFTGRMERFISVTGKNAVRCEYEIPGRKFWMSFIAYTCPQTVEVQ